MGHSVHQALILIILLVFCLCGCKEKALDYPPRQMPSGLIKDAVQRQAGQKLFIDKCATCHGKPGEGRSERAIFFAPPAPDFTESDYRNIDPAYLYWRIESGKTVEPYRSEGSVMPAWGVHFSDQQIWQIVIYLMTRAR